MTAFALRRTGDADYPRYLKVLLQGPPKAGKTTFLSTAPNIVIAACEAGLMSIAHKDVPYVEVDGTDKLQTLQLILSDEDLRATAARNLGLPKIETVAIDTLDAYQEMLKKEILKENRRTSMEQRDWGTLKERMAAILKAFVALPVNVIFTVHTSTTQDDESRLIYAPALQGAIKDEIAGYVDFSLLAFRQREVDAQGHAAVKYYLRNEGDLKNPTLGNRAAGRVPEISLPNFQDLHDAVFRGITRQDPSMRPDDIIVEVSKPVSQPQPAPAPAQNPSQPQVTEGDLADAAQPPVAPQPPEAQPQASAPVAGDLPNGVPADDSGKPINASGITMLTKQYMEHSFARPEDLETWTLGKARSISRFFTAWKADKATGQNPTRDELIGFLQGMDAWAGELPGIQTGVENVVAPSKVSNQPEQEVPSQEPSAEKSTTPQEAGTPEPERPAQELAAEAEATALIQDVLGGEIVVTEESLCQECGSKIDDVDVAQLAVTRLKKVLCFADYKKAIART